MSFGDMLKVMLPYTIASAILGPVGLASIPTAITGDSRPVLFDLLWSQ